ncbi:glucosyl-3-phosphoglycerate synthase [Janibacter cremeus]|uniref:glucosyl-3-phosphoglycerate synthase n=1 Tax=Janibacter cremeus TaxID=1285192 RepID=UPI0023F94D31|nr:glucosyl-3-phosphoglycerate synthase [Janibacter cremeus]WEV77744.1 glucosyl-3-phosphoglycerate synthase [Janibacter cremeus]
MEDVTLEWLDAHSHHHEDFAAADLVERLRAKGETVTVVIPARNEAETVGDVVSVLRRELVEDTPLVTELVVIDSDSTDATARVAADAGATVHRSVDIAPRLGSHPGKGEALWKSLFVTTGDHLVFVDADLTSWGPHFVTGLVGALTADPTTQLVKGWYDRVLDVDGQEPSTEGGRVTELVARPVLDLWWPQLAGVVQPLAGEWAVRRSLMESITVPTGYGVEIATLIDTHARHGLEAIAQVDLGARAHRHQKDHDLAVMAAELLAVVNARCHGTAGSIDVAAQELQQFTRDGGWRSRPVPLAQRPQAREQTGYPGGRR